MFAEGLDLITDRNVLKRGWKEKHRDLKIVTERKQTGMQKIIRNLERELEFEQGGTLEASKNLLKCG